MIICIKEVFNNEFTGHDYYHALRVESIANKIVDVEISSKIENFVKLRDILLEKGAIEVNPVFLKEEVVEDNAEHKVDANEGVIKSAAKYINEIKDDKINNNKLLECFKNILKELK